MPKHLIWDFDGTLYDTYPMMADALLAALADFHLHAEPAEALALLKITLYHAIETYARRAGLSPDELMAAFRAHHAQQDRFPPMAGLRECFARTQQMGCSHYLFTHRDERALDQLKQDGLSDAFTDTVTRRDGFADKPAPDAILHLMQKHGFAPGDAVMIGDRDIDVCSGQAAGVHTMLLDPDGFYPGLHRDARIGSLMDIPQALTLLR